MKKVMVLAAQVAQQGICGSWLALHKPRFNQLPPGDDLETAYVTNEVYEVSHQIRGFRLKATSM
jgi:hypothetical protein